MLKHKEIQDTIVVYLKGRIDIHNASEMLRDFNELFTKFNNHHFILNMSLVQYMSSSGIGFLVQTQQRQNKKDREFFICEANTAVSKIFSAVGMSDSFKVFATEADALDAL